MGFKADVESDIDVFLDLDEMGEEHTVDGVSMVCIIDASGREQMTSDPTGIAFASTVSLFARTSDLAALSKTAPKPGHTLSIDDEKYMVVGVSDEDGITRMSMTVGGS